MPRADRLTPVTPAELSRRRPGCRRGSRRRGRPGRPASRPRSRSSGPRSRSTATTRPRRAAARPSPPAGRRGRSPSWSPTRLAGRRRGRRGRRRRARASSTSPSTPPRRASWPARSSTAGAAYGSGDAMAGEKVNLEFVSANPTGPVHLGGARWAAVGDALGRILSAQGADGHPRVLLQRRRRADRPVRPVAAGAAKGEPAPEDGYGGDYIAEIAARVVAPTPRRPRPARRRGAGGVPARAASS